jgi:hypothetical protein
MKYKKTVANFQLRNLAIPNRNFKNDDDGNDDGRKKQ